MNPLDLLGEKADLTVQVDKTIAQPGEQLKINVQLVAKKNLYIRRAIVELVCVETYVDRVYVKGSYIHKKFADKDVATKKAFIKDEIMNESNSRSDDVVLTIPRNPLPTLTGAVIRGIEPGISWHVQAVLDIPHARDVRAVQNIIVIKASDTLNPPPETTNPPPRLADPYDKVIIKPPEDGTLQPQWAVSESKSSVCALTLNISQDSVRSYSTVEGTLQAEILKDIKVSRVLIELERMEKFGYDQQCFTVNKATLEENIVLHADETLQWPFKLDIVGMLLSLNTKHSTVKWMVKGRLDIPLRLDSCVVQDINLVT